MHALAAPALLLPRCGATVPMLYLPPQTKPSMPLSLPLSPSLSLSLSSPLPSPLLFPPPPPRALPPPSHPPPSLTLYPSPHPLLYSPPCLRAQASRITDRTNAPPVRRVQHTDKLEATAVDSLLHRDVDPGSHVYYTSVLADQYLGGTEAPPPPPDAEAQALCAGGPLASDPRPVNFMERNRRALGQYAAKRQQQRDEAANRKTGARAATTLSFADTSAGPAAPATPPSPAATPSPTPSQILVQEVLQQIRIGLEGLGDGDAPGPVGPQRRPRDASPQVAPATAADRAPAQAPGGRPWNRHTDPAHYMDGPCHSHSHSHSHHRPRPARVAPRAGAPAPRRSAPSAPPPAPAASDPPPPLLPDGPATPASLPSAESAEPAPPSAPSSPEASTAHLPGPPPDSPVYPPPASPPRPPAPAPLPGPAAVCEPVPHAARRAHAPTAAPPRKLLRAGLNEHLVQRPAPKQRAASPASAASARPGSSPTLTGALQELQQAMDQASRYFLQKDAAPSPAPSSSAPPPPLDSPSLPSPADPRQPGLAVRSPSTSLEASSLTASDDSRDSRGGARGARDAAPGGPPPRGPAPESQRSSPGGSARPSPGPSTADRRRESVPASTLTLASTEGTATLAAQRPLPSSRSPTGTASASATASPEA